MRARRAQRAAAAGRDPLRAGRAWTTRARWSPRYNKLVTPSAESLWLAVRIERKPAMRAAEESSPRSCARRFPTSRRVPQAAARSPMTEAWRRRGRRRARRPRRQAARAGAAEVAAAAQVRPAPARGAGGRPLRRAARRHLRARHGAQLRAAAEDRSRAAAGARSPAASTRPTRNQLAARFSQPVPFSDAGAAARWSTSACRSPSWWWSAASPTSGSSDAARPAQMAFVKPQAEAPRATGASRARLRARSAPCAEAAAASRRKSASRSRRSTARSPQSQAVAPEKKAAERSPRPSSRRRRHRAALRRPPHRHAGRDRRGVARGHATAAAASWCRR